MLALLIVSAGTMVALFEAGGRAYEEQNELASKETEMGKPPVKQGNTGEAPKQETVKQTVLPRKTDTKETKTTEEAHVPVSEAELEDQFMEAPEMAEASTGDVTAEEFDTADAITLQWPVEGEVLLPFSMDHSIYFPTLAQYQYNPALIVGALEGTPVLSASSGTVTDVGKTNEYGHYVTVDIGDGYELTYGQLFDITAEVGEELDAGEQIALVAYPTRSFVEEGDNLYLRLTKDGVSVDPSLYLK